MSIDSSASQSLKTLAPIDLTESGMLIDLREGQFARRPLQIVEVPLANVTLSSFGAERALIHVSKWVGSITSSPSGIVIVLSEVHPSKMLP